MTKVKGTLQHTSGGLRTIMISFSYGSTLGPGLVSFTAEQLSFKLKRQFSGKTIHPDGVCLQQLKTVLPSWLSLSRRLLTLAYYKQGDSWSCGKYQVLFQ